MFWKKQKTIEHLTTVCQLKDAEKRAATAESSNDRKRLIVALRDCAVLRDMYHKKANELAACMEEKEALKADIEKRRRLYRHGSEILQEKVKQFAIFNRQLQESVHVYEHNYRALCTTYEALERENKELRELTGKLTGRLETFERMVQAVEKTVSGEKE